MPESNHLPGSPEALKQAAAENDLDADRRKAAFVASDEREIKLKLREQIEAAAVSEAARKDEIVRLRKEAHDFEAVIKRLKEDVGEQGELIRATRKQRDQAQGEAAAWIKAFELLNQTHGMFAQEVAGQLSGIAQEKRRPPRPQGTGMHTGGYGDSPDRPY